MKKWSLVILVSVALILIAGTMVPAHSALGSPGIGPAFGPKGDKDQPTPVPEPSTLITLGVAAMGLFVARRSMKNR